MELMLAKMQEKCAFSPLSIMEESVMIIYYVFSQELHRLLNLFVKKFRKLCSFK